MLNFCYSFTGLAEVGYILRAVMFSAFMAMLSCSRARRENRRIARYVTVFATPLSDKRARQKTENVAARSISEEERL